MKNNIQYRWSIKLDSSYSVYSFAMLYGQGFSVSTLASYKNEVSGFVKKENLGSLVSALIPFGYSFKDKNINLVTVDTFWKNWDKYSK